MAKKSLKASPPRIDNWQDRPNNARPTKERLSKSAMRLIDGETAGERYALDEYPDELGRLQHRGQITARQVEAGRRYEELARSAIGSPSSKDCIAALHRVDCQSHDDNDDEPTADEVATRREWRDMVTLLHMSTQRELMRVCWEQAKTRNIAALRMGLDIAADFWKISS